MKMKTVPQRRCVGCGESFPKGDLLRVVRTPEGEIKLDFTGKLNGRGAYVCKKAECFRIAGKKKRLASNLSAEIPEEVLSRLERETAIYEKEAGAAE